MSRFVSEGLKLDDSKAVLLLQLINHDVYGRPGQVGLSLVSMLIMLLQVLC